jgi:2,5-diamino-6-(ribosylamino)-4(3H)-pyrimidinone 5'-phosphate reductase
MEGRPYVIVNVAATADGKLAARERRQLRISGPEDRARVDRLRASVDAIAVGVGTVLADDPGLAVRSAELRRKRAARGLPPNPLRVVLDSAARTPPGAEFLRRGPGRRLIFTSRRAPRGRAERLSRRADVVVAGGRRVSMPRALAHLRRRGVKRLLVEGGPTLLWSLFREGLVDELSVYVGPLFVGGEGAPSILGGEGFPGRSPGELRLVSVERLGPGVLLRWKAR